MSIPKNIGYFQSICFFQKEYINFENIILIPDKINYFQKGRIKLGKRIFIPDVLN